MMFDTNAPPARWVVTYVLNGRRHATRHVEGCGTLKRARNNQDTGEPLEAGKRQSISQHGVLEEGRYLSAAPADFPAPVDHSCVSGAAAIVEAIQDAEAMSRSAGLSLREADLILALREIKTQATLVGNTVCADIADAALRSAGLAE